jgi:hypothetical protein
VFGEFPRLIGKPIHPAPESAEHKEHQHNHHKEDNADCKQDRYQDILLS